MLSLRRITQFKKDYKRCLKRGGDIENKLHDVIDLLARGKKLDAKYRDHSYLGE
jgi:mRNA interferase YafQ